MEARRFRIVAENPATQLPTAQVSRSTVVVVGVDGDEKVCRPARGAEERNAGLGAAAGPPSLLTRQRASVHLFLRLSTRVVPQSV